MVKRLHVKAGVKAGVENMPDQHLAGELHKPIIRRFKKQKVHADLSDMQLICKLKTKEIVFLCDIGIFSKYAWVFSLKSKKDDAITNASQKIIDESGRKPNKIWIDEGSEFRKDQ